MEREKNNFLKLENEAGLKHERLTHLRSITLSL